MTTLSNKGNSSIYWLRSIFVTEFLKRLPLVGNNVLLRNSDRIRKLLHTSGKYLMVWLVRTRT